MGRQASSGERCLHDCAGGCCAPTIGLISHSVAFYSCTYAENDREREGERMRETEGKRRT